MAKKENNMYKKIDGIIVSEYPFEESSKIINILTKEILEIETIYFMVRLYNLVTNTNL